MRMRTRTCTRANAHAHVHTHTHTHTQEPVSLTETDIEASAPPKNHYNPPVSLDEPIATYKKSQKQLANERKKAGGVIIKAPKSIMQVERDSTTKLKYETGDDSHSNPLMPEATTKVHTRPCKSSTSCRCKHLLAGGRRS